MHGSTKSLDDFLNLLENEESRLLKARRARDAVPVPDQEQDKQVDNVNEVL